MSGKRSRSITGWRQVKPERGASKRPFLPLVAAKAATPAPSPETAGGERWESEGGSLKPPADLAPAALAAKPKIGQ